MVACGLARPLAFGFGSSAYPVAFQALKAPAMGVTLLGSTSVLAGLVAFQSLPFLTSVYDSAPWLTATSVTSFSDTSQMVLSRNSIGRLLTCSTPYFLTTKICGDSPFFT